MTNTDTLKEIIRDVPDFPKEGILFKDITTLLKDTDAFKSAVDMFVDELAECEPDFIVGIESRGFIFSPVIAYKLGAGFIPVRKKGKLPHLTEQVAYELEYGEAVLEIHKDAFEKGAKVVIVDDLLATGGTAQAAGKLVESLGGKIQKMAFLIELEFLKGREKLSSHDIYSVIKY